VQEARRHGRPVLKHTALRYRLKTSIVRDLYWKMRGGRWIDVRRREVEFYRILLNGFRQGDLIFDVGANEGSKSDVFLRLGARVVAIEPDETNQEVLRSSFLRYRLVPRPVTIVGKALSDQGGIETMWIDGPGSALNTLSQKWVATLQSNKMRIQHGHYGLEFSGHTAVETTTLEQLILTHGMPFFVKIDVEGYEARVLRGLKRPVPFLSFEVNLPEFRLEGLECVKLLQGLAAAGKFNYAADCQRGLVLDKWVDGQDFRELLQHCCENSIEVFWQSCLPCSTPAGPQATYTLDAAHTRTARITGDSYGPEKFPGLGD